MTELIEVSILNALVEIIWQRILTNTVFYVPSESIENWPVMIW